MKTYILKTIEGEFYCGKTNNLDKRLDEHKKKRNGSWFQFKKRCEFDTILIIDGDYEKEIKRFGVRKFVELTEELRRTFS